MGEMKPSWLTRSHRTLLLLIVFCGVLSRLYLIDQPLLEYSGWRQCDTAAVARNFYEESMNILYPRVDWRGTSPGYVQSEFPIYAFLVAILYRVFGVHEFLGRVLNVGLYVLSAVLLFRLVRRLFGERIALLSVFFYSFVPLSFLFTRRFYSDPLMALGSLAGVYYFWVWTEKGRWPPLALSALAVCVAVLIKPISLYLGIPLLYLSYRKFGWRLFRLPILWLFAVAVFIPSLIWYAHAANLWEAYGNSFYVAYLKLGFPALTDRFWLSLGKRLLLRLIFEMASPAGLLFLLVGFFTAPPQRNYLAHWWAAGFAVTILLWPRGHTGHDYYQLPLVFLTAAWMAYGAVILWEKKVVSRRFSRPLVTVLCLSVLGLSAWQLRDMMTIPEHEWVHLAFAERVEKLTEPGAPMIFARSRPDFTPPEFLQHRTAQGEYLHCDPMDFYLSHRKGWSIDQTMATPEFLETLRRRGAKYFATFDQEIFKRHPELKTALERSYIPLEVTPQWAIYRLDHPTPAHSKPLKNDQVVGPHAWPSPTSEPGR
jgi:hypothetical protein